ncbi:MAG: hypothetical protein N2Z79_05320, partial [Candidatus Omnitrophica bacterium]|nr:hypothetical protein [Candidatus Omnitrophota bacterium]
MYRGKIWLGPNSGKLIQLDNNSFDELNRLDIRYKDKIIIKINGENPLEILDKIKKVCLGKEIESILSEADEEEDVGAVDNIYRRYKFGQQIGRSKINSPGDSLLASSSALSSSTGIKKNESYPVPIIEKKPLSSGSPLQISLPLIRRITLSFFIIGIVSAGLSLIYQNKNLRFSDLCLYSLLVSLGMVTGLTALLKYLNRRKDSSQNKEKITPFKFKEKQLVIALGGNAFRKEGQSRQNYGEIIDEIEQKNINEFASVLGDLLENDFRFILTHGNGPQAGEVLDMAFRENKN